MLAIPLGTMSDPSETAVKTLLAHSRNLCFYERCEELLTHPRWKRVNARIAHIKGEHPGSARHDPLQPDAERQGYENLMLLCPKHHTLVDDLEPDAHSVERLQEMRANHLLHASEGLWCTHDDLSRFAAMAIAQSRVDSSRSEDAVLTRILEGWLPLAQEYNMVKAHPAQLDAVEELLRKTRPDEVWLRGVEFTTASPEFGDDANNYEVKLIDGRLRYTAKGKDNWKPSSELP